MSNLVPKTLVDKNGHTTTRMVNPDKGNEASAGRVGSSATPVPAAQNLDAPELVFDSELIGIENKEFFDVRDVKEAFDNYAEAFRSYIEENPEFEDTPASEIASDEFEDFQKEADTFAKALTDLGTSAPDAPEENSTLEDWAAYAESIGEEWEGIQNNHGVTMIADSYLEEYAEEFAQDTGAIPREGLPSFIENNINWKGVGEDMVRYNNWTEINGTKFYST